MVKYYIYFFVFVNKKSKKTLAIIKIMVIMISLYKQLLSFTPPIMKTIEELFDPMNGLNTDVETAKNRSYDETSDTYYLHMETGETKEAIFDYNQFFITLA